MITLTDNNFHQIIADTSKPLVVKWSANWCGPCRTFAPTYRRWSQIYSNLANFAECDLDNCPNVSSNFRVGAVPTIIVFKNGLEFRRWVGAPAENNLVSAIS